MFPEPSVLKVNFKQNGAKFNQKLVYNILSGNELGFCFSSKNTLMVSLRKQSASCKIQFLKL